MITGNFIDAHPLRRAFIANLLDRTAALLTAQGERLLQDAGLSFPSRASSAVLLMGERGSASAADIAAALDLPHQLATQRVELLLSLGLFERIDDPDDGRRKILRLTAKGANEFQILQAVLQDASNAFQSLFEDIDSDLQAVLDRMISALNQRPVLERVQAYRSPARNQTDD